MCSAWRREAPLGVSPIVIQDGSSFAIKDALKEVFPGRFKKVKPAAVEAHATLGLVGVNHFFP